MSKNIDFTYKYERDFDKDTPKLLEYLFNGGKDPIIISKMVKHGLNLIKNNYDCSDFRIEIFTRILFGYKDVIGKEVEKEITDVLFNFPFIDMSSHSMCTWTENHQLILNVSEYLLGNMYKEAIFDGGITGIKLSEIAYSKMNEWIDFIYRFGFSEYGSCNYYPETLAALGNIIEFSFDEKLREKFKIVLDLLCYDIFSAATEDLTYNKATARAYVDNKINYYNYLKPHIMSLLDQKVTINHEREACFFLMLRAKDKNNMPIYTLPKVFIYIFKRNEKLTKESNGLKSIEYKENGLLEYIDKNVLYIMTTGTGGSYITNKNVLKYLDEHKMWNHSMFRSLKPYRFILKTVPCLFPIIRKITKKNLGDLSYSRGNTITYLKDGFSISSLSKYHVGEPSFQQVTHMININGISVFTTSPAKDKSQTGSPDYWIGNKTNPDCIQNKNILIVYYKKPKLTHLYFPVESFDKVNLDYLYLGLLFARSKNTNIVVRTNNTISFDDTSNDKSIKQDGKTPNFNLTKYDVININKKDHYYIFEVDTSLSFEEFIKENISYNPSITKNHITYKNIDFNYLKSSFIDGKEMIFSYKRFESDFIAGGSYTYNENNKLIFDCDNASLTIDFKNITRVEDIKK